MNQRIQGIGMTSRRTRERMIERLKQQGISNNDVLEVMKNTPRHIFVDEALASRAYEDTPLPIGYNQTISQPYIVAQMTELLLGEMIKKTNKVLEIGTGCGYQTAVLAQLVDEVYSLERIAALQKKARQNLNDLKLLNIRLRHSDGTNGWQENAPFDGILVSAAIEEIPEALLQQLAIEGVLIIPVGSRHRQVLQKVTRTHTGHKIENLEAVSFVPFLSGTE